MKRIFLAEDSVIQAKTFMRVLTRIPRAEIQRFDDGLKVYTETMRKPPDLLVLDIMLPSLNGGAILGLLKRDRMMRKVPVLMLSAISEEGTEEQLLEMGADAYLAKPIKPDQLLETATRLLT